MDINSFARNNFGDEFRDESINSNYQSDSDSEILQKSTEIRNQTNRDRSLVYHIERFIDTIHTSRSQNTGKTYHNAMNAYVEMLRDRNRNNESFQIESVLVDDLTETSATEFSDYLKAYSPTTETLYINVFKSFVEYLAAENVLHLNLYRVKQLIKRRTRIPGVRLPQFPEEDIRKVLDYALALPSYPYEKQTDLLINLRDSAFLLTLADTGLRIHEICALRMGDINWRSRKAIIIGKGNKQAVIRFSERSLLAMRKYTEARFAAGEKSIVSRSALPVFSRHDKGSGDKILPISTKTGRLIVSERVEQCLGKDAVGTITPHSLRHYFVTTVLQATGNLKIAQEFARHTNIAVTQRYSHLANDELDNTYSSIFDD